MSGGSNVPPALTVQANGVAVLSDQYMNGLVQGGALLPQIRSFTGLSGMNVWMLGFAVPNDGGQGMFYWNASAIQADDGGVTTIQPNGALYGRWIRQAATVGSAALVTNIASLRAATSSTLSAAVAYVEGYLVGADGGEGNFWYNASDTTSADNGGTIIVDASNRRWYREGVFRSEFNVLWFGGNAASDYAPILTRILAYITLISSTTIGASVYFPPGKYPFGSGVSWSYPAGVVTFGLTLCGAGADTSTLCWSGGAVGVGLQLNSTDHSIHVQDLTFSTTQNGGATALSLVQTAPMGIFPQNDLTQLTFRGDTFDSSAEWWSVGVLVQGVSNVHYLGCLFLSYNAQGTGLQLEGNSAVSPYYTIVHNITACGFFGHAFGLIYGAYVQGVTVAQTNFTNGTTCIYVPAGANSSIAQLGIVNCQFNSTGDQINMSGGGGGLYVTGSLFYVTSGHSGITFPDSTGNQALITGNSFNGPGGQSGTPDGTGILAAVHFDYGIVTGNAFEGLTDGVVLSGCAGWNVQANGYRNCTTAVVPGTGNSVGVATS